MTELMQRLLAAKTARRRELAALPIMEKLRILERLRDRDLLIRASRPTQRDSPSSPRDDLPGL